MALTYNVNNTPATGAAAMFILKTLLKSLSPSPWTILRSSDGTTYNSSGDQITTNTTGAGGMANTNAWFVAQMPGGGRQICIQRGTTNVVWRMKYSLSAGFSGGSPGATQTPSATDETIFSGGGSDASPTFSTVMGADGSYRYNCAADAASPYGFWSFGFPTGSATINNCTAGMFLDFMTTGTSVGSDPDPYVVACNTSAALGSGIATGSKGWNAATSAYASLVTTTQPATPSSGWVTDPATGKHVLRVVEWFFSGSIYKGVSKYFLWETCSGTNTPTPLTLVTGVDKMVSGYAVVDWNNSTIVI